MTADNTGYVKCPDCGQDDCVFHLAYLAQRDDIILPLRPNRRYVVQGKIVPRIVTEYGGPPLTTQ